MSPRSLCQWWVLAGACALGHSSWAQQDPASSSLSSRWAFSASPFLQSSEWQERNGNGQVLLRERGILPGLKLQGAYRSELGQAIWTGHISRGQRDYDGQTQGGRPVQTQVDVRLQSHELALMRHWSNGLSAGLAWAHRAQDRSILTVPGVATGYTERWRSDEMRMRLGTQWTAGGDWSAQASWALWARTCLTFQASSVDSAQLCPKRQRVAQLDLNWHRALDPNWSWGVWGQWQWRHADRSEPVAMTRFGRVLGSLAQPETEETLWSAGLQLTRHW